MKGPGVCTYVIHDDCTDPTSDEMIFYVVDGNESLFRKTHQKEDMKIKSHVTINCIDIHGMYLKQTHLTIHVTNMYDSIEIMNMINGLDIYRN